MKSISLIVLVLMCWLNPVQAQTETYTIKGKTIDRDTGEELPFVTVVIKDSQIGCVTDFEGNYQLKFDPNEHDPETMIVVYRTISYRSVELEGIRFKQGVAEVDVKLQPDGYPPPMIVISYDYDPYSERQTVVDF